MTVATYQWTLERYHQAVDAGIFGGENVELIHGELVLMTPEGPSHVFFSDRFAKLLQRLLQTRAQVREGHPITLPDHSEPQPDLVIVAPLDAEYLDHHPYPADIFWLVEYSNSTLAYDLGDKQRLYSQAEIPEYWVVNLVDGEVNIFREPQPTGYQQHQIVQTGSISPLSFPDVAIEVERLFRQ